MVEIIKQRSKERFCAPCVSVSLSLSLSVFCVVYFLVRLKDQIDDLQQLVRRLENERDEAEMGEVLGKAKKNRKKTTCAVA